MKELRFAESAGFCFGVRRSVEMAERLMAERGGCCSLGELIHNEDVVERLKAQGLRVIQSPEEAQRGGDTLLECAHDGAGAENGLLPAAQHAHVAAFYGQRRRIGGDVRAAFIDYCDEAERNLHLIDMHTVRVHGLGEDAPGVVGQGGCRTYSVRHAAHALLVEAQPVQHHLGYMSARPVHVLPVAGEDVPGAFLKACGHGRRMRSFSSAEAPRMLPQAALVFFKSSVVVMAFHSFVFVLCARKRVPAGFPATMS